MCASCIGFAACEPDEPKFIESNTIIFQTNLDINGVTVHQTIMEDVTIRVSPSKIKCGEEFAIERTHHNNENVTLIISSKSLDFKEQVVTPFTIKKKVEAEGDYDLEFTYTKDNRNISASTKVYVSRNE